MLERKETGVHGTLLMSQDDWKLNSKQLLSKTLNSRMNIIETRAVLESSKRTESETRAVFEYRQKRRNICFGGQTGGPRKVNYLPKPFPEHGDHFSL